MGATINLRKRQLPCGRLATNFSEMDSDEDDEELCEYERKRLQNIKRNNEFLRSLGECKVASR